MPSATTLSNNNEPPLAISQELRILLVEDSARLRIRLTDMLTQPGVSRVVATAATESEARDLMTAQDFDVLVVDVELREGSGIAVVSYARARWLVPPIPLIIVLTNYALPTVRERSLAAGADYFLDKMREFNQVYPLILGRHH
jgi:two-component system, OmpR family, response regulator